MLAEQAIHEVEAKLKDADDYLSLRRLDPDWRRRVTIGIAQSDIILSELETKHSMKIHILSKGQLVEMSRLRNQVQMIKDKILSDSIG